MTGIQDIQDQFDTWFPNGAVYQVDSDGDSESYITPYIAVTGGSLAKPQIQVRGDPHESDPTFQIDRWDITQKDPLVLTFHTHDTDVYQLGARVPESVYSDPGFQADRTMYQDLAAEAQDQVS